jgi:hypothetical protein
MDADPSELKELLTKAIEECTDSLTLDLLYKILILD